MAVPWVERMSGVNAPRQLLSLTHTVCPGILCFIFCTIPLIQRLPSSDLNGKKDKRYAGDTRTYKVYAEIPHIYGYRLSVGNDACCAQMFCNTNCIILRCRSIKYLMTSLSGHKRDTDGQTGRYRDLHMGIKWTQTH